MGIDPHPGFYRRRREDRRHHTRVALSVAAQLEHAEVRLLGQVEDISADGACFVTPTVTPALASGTTATLVLQLAGELGETTHTAVIVRCEELFDGESDVLAYSLRFDEAIDVSRVTTQAE